MNCVSIRLMLHLYNRLYLILIILKVIANYFISLKIKSKISSKYGRYLSVVAYHYFYAVLCILYAKYWDSLYCCGRLKF